MKMTLYRLVVVIYLVEFKIKQYELEEEFHIPVSSQN